ncbi:hypothetical protein [Hoeflea ulvae]|uniref:Hydrogenase maturation nickel metallochaperone HypA n=1 Tax=Hoeflea ulvae TaxID=2983764 RepID=A0ABT3YDG6_9HYPH|nr:hypothetical protein [Hoeflea ulvae]MCY0093925.1 hydrogenase maturation nickel metallochaperone HypA [Hoeflea ulvae]
MDLSRMPKGKPSVALPLCLNCAEYVRRVDAPCPHCGHDTTVPGGRYKDDGFYARDALERLLTVMEQATTRTPRKTKAED